MTDSGDHDLWMLPIVDTSLEVVCTHCGGLWRITWFDHFAGRGINEIDNWILERIAEGVEPNDVSEAWIDADLASRVSNGSPLSAGLRHLGTS